MMQTMKRDAFAAKLDGLLMREPIEDYCPNGLQVEGDDEIASVAVGVSASVKTIEAAVEVGVNALVVHHGIFWNRDPYPLVGTKKKKVQLLLDAGISLFAYHLPLDTHQEVGNNWRAAIDMGWENLESVGLGVAGTTSEVSVEVFQEGIEKYYGHVAHAATGGPKNIQRVALCSGGGWREVSNMAKLGMDAYITGNFDEPAWHQAHEEGIHFFAMGHSASERVGPRALGKWIEKNLSITTTFIDIENPF